MTTDLHNHVIPGVDDGAADVHASREALRAFVADDVGQVIATPHLMGSITLESAALALRLAELDVGWERLRVVAGEFPGLAVRRGCEVMLDVPEPSFEDERLRLGGGVTVLVEFPFMMVPPQAARPLAVIAGQGLRPLLAHAERYAGVTVEGVEEWRQAGAGIQVNGPSLLGKHGDGPRRVALELLERGLVDCLSSDYHARSRPLVAEYRAYLLEHGAEEQAGLLMDVNPARAVAGERMIPIGPVRLRRPGLLSSISSLWRRPRRRRERG